MARLIKTNGEVVTVYPRNGKKFTLEELQEFVGGGYIEMVRTLSGKPMFVNEDGKRLKMAVNRKATDIAGLYPYDEIVGNAIICEKDEVS